jgi:hypothetical protein
VLLALVLLSCAQGTRGRSREPDAGRADVARAADACDPDASHPGPPFTFDRMRNLELGETFELAIAAVGPGRVGILVGKPGLEYLDSLDGGQTFRPPIATGAMGRDKLHFAMGQGFAFLSYAHVTSGAQLFLQRAPLAAGGVTAFSPPVMVSAQDAQSGELVFGPGQRLALNTSNSGAVDGLQAHAWSKDLLEEITNSGPRRSTSPTTGARISRTMVTIRRWHVVRATAPHRCSPWAPAGRTSG